MPENIEEDAARQEKLVNSGGVSEKTLKKRKYFADLFDNFIQKRQSKRLTDLLNDPEQLETVLLSYFESMRVNAEGKIQLPKKNYLDSVLSNIKLWILTQTEQKEDISRFPKLRLLLKSLHKELKENGRGDTTHYEPIDDESLGRTFSFIALVTNCFITRGTPAFEENIAKLPFSCRKRFHYMLQASAQFLMTLLDCRRGRKGLVKLTKDHYKKCYSRKHDLYYYSKTKGEVTKNHQRDDENIGTSGIIPFQENKFGCNPGKTLELYLSILHPKFDKFFQKPRVEAKNFSLGDEKETVYFYALPVGESKVGEMMATFCDVLGLEHYTNHCIRSTGITMLKKCGYEDRTIMKISGHKCVASLDNYDPSTSLDKRSEMASAMMMADPLAQKPPGNTNPPDEDEGFTGFRTQVPRKQQDEESDSAMISQEMDEPFFPTAQAAATTRQQLTNDEEFDTAVISQEMDRPFFTTGQAPTKQKKNLDRSSQLPDLFVETAGATSHGKRRTPAQGCYY